MALPGNAPGFVLVGGTYDDPSFQGMAGKLTLSAPVTHVATGERVRKTWNFSIDYNGQFSVGPLPWTDDPAFTPTGFTYTVEWQALAWKDTPGNVTFQVPRAAGSTVDFDTLVPALGGGQTIPLGVYSVNGKQGAVTLAASDVGADASGAATAAQAAAVVAAATDASSRIAAEVTRADGKYVATAGLDAATAPLVTGNGTTAGALRAAYVPFLTLALNPDMLISGTITRDANGAATSAPVTWPDGTTGTYTADTVSTAFPGAVDAYHVTYAGATTKTYTQPAVTRDSNGAVTARPALTVA